MDDIITYGQTFSECQMYLVSVLRGLGKAGLKVKPNKCQLFHREVAFLGQVVSLPPTRMISWWSVTGCPTPALREYYSSFVPGFAMVKGAKIMSLEECQDMFQQLKEALCTTLILAYLDLEAPMTLDTDSQL